MEPSKEIIQDYLFRFSLVHLESNPGDYEVNSGGEEGGGRFATFDDPVNELMGDGLPSVESCGERGREEHQEMTQSNMSSMARRIDSARREVARATSARGRMGIPSIFQSVLVSTAR